MNRKFGAESKPKAGGIGCRRRGELLRIEMPPESTLEVGCHVGPLSELGRYRMSDIERRSMAAYICYILWEIGQI
jgi:hypothetical protein